VRIINWLWNNTVSPEAQELCMIDSYVIQMRWQAQSVQELETREDIDPDAGREELFGIMRERNHLRTELEARGYSYDGESFSREDSGEDMNGEDQEESCEDVEDEPQRGFFSRLFFG
jgi:hypothetical protein